MSMNIELLEELDSSRIMAGMMNTDEKMFDHFQCAVHIATQTSQLPSNHASDMKSPISSFVGKKLLLLKVL